MELCPKCNKTLKEINDDGISLERVCNNCGYMSLVVYGHGDDYIGARPPTKILNLTPPKEK